MRNPRGRLARLERWADRATGGDLRRHWERVNADRLEHLYRFGDLIPDTHAAPILAAVEAITDRLFVDGPAWLPEDAPAVQRWVMERVALGTDHPMNPPFPGQVPGAYIDLLLAHPEAVLWANSCPACKMHVPSTPPRRRPDGYFDQSQPLADTCPVCGAHVPPPRRC